MVKYTFVTGLMLAMTALVGCDEVKVSDESINVVREPWVVEQMGQPGVALVDVRKAEAYAEGHLPGAINIYLPEIYKADPRLAGAEQIIIYASGWTDPLSPAAAKKMMKLGYVGVHEFKGGIEVWKSSGRELVKTQPPSEGRPETSK